MDTKGQELAFVCEHLRDIGISAKMVDVGTLKRPVIEPDISREQVQQSLGELDRSRAAASIPSVQAWPLDLGTPSDRGSAIAAMADALRAFLLSELALGRVCGVLGLGGSGGTSLITTAMRALPIGMPKLMVSTVASGNVAPYVDCSDITMMYSVVDVAGLNAVSEVVLSNAAFAMAGMVQHRRPLRHHRPAIGLTMFGVTTPCVDQVRVHLEAEGFDCLVFHATGSGGRAMEQLVASGLISGVLDVTTTEVADEVVGGVFPAGPHRFEKLLQAEIPLVLSLGALDMVNFGGMETVPERFKNRKLHAHNAQVTLMRTTIEENRRIATFIADKLNRASAPWCLLVPEVGVSSLDAPGQPFHDPQADAALFDQLEQRLQRSSDRRVIRLPYHINDSEFSLALVEQFRELQRR